MRTAPWICAAVVGGMALVGCGNKDENKPATPAGNSPTTTDMSTAAGNAAGAAGNAGNSMMSGAGNMMSAAGNSMSSAGNSMSASASGGMSQSDVNATITRIQGYINSKQFDEADAELKKLEANSSSYPPAVQSTITGLRSTLTAAKSMPTTMPSGLNGLMNH